VLEIAVGAGEVVVVVVVALGQGVLWETVSVGVPTKIGQNLKGQDFVILSFCSILSFWTEYCKRIR
jgi:hypothetical protein